MIRKSELQQLFFDLIAKMVRNKNPEQDIDIILEGIYNCIEADFLSVYTLFDGNSYFRFLGSQGTRIDLDPVLSLAKGECHNPKNFFHNEVDETDIQLIPFNFDPNVKIMLVLIKENPLSRQSIDVLASEGMKFFDIYSERKMGEYHKDSNKFLLDISTKLMKSNDKLVVLSEIDQALKGMYPHSPYSIFLTQEYNDIDGLPFKIMEYSNGSMENIVSQVFMTAELKVKRRKEAGQKIIYAPLLGEQSVYGVLEIIFPDQDIVKEEELDFIYEFSHLAGKALEKTILYENSLMQVNNLTFLHEIIHQLNSSRELTEITGIVRNKMMKISKADEVGFIYFNENEEEGYDVLDGSTAYIQTDEGMKVVQRLKTVIDKVPEPIFSGDFTVVDVNEYHSLMVFPMLHSGTNQGFIVALGKEKNMFTFESFKLIKTLIQHSSLAMANTILTKQLEQSVITDHLTKLYSRRYLEEQIEIDMESGSRGVLILFDIDDFKNVNDVYGHQVGDKVLKACSKTLKKEAGKESIAARWGGEELAVYVPVITLEEGAALANKIRKAVGNKTEPTVTVSCGVAEWQQHNEHNIEKLFLEADHALYRAKETGKNRVIIHKYN